MRAATKELMVGFLTAVCLSAGLPCARACNVPVFRWALENWEADCFEVMIFHRHRLGEPDREVVRFLEASSSDRPGGANLLVRVVDVSAEMDAPIAEIWKSLSHKELPLMVLLSPPGPETLSPRPVWSGPVDMRAAEGIVDSPLRRRIAGRLASGDSAVWVLLESGDKDADDRAAELLRTELKRAEKTIELPDPYPLDVWETPTTSPADVVEPDPPEELKASFSLVRLRRNDPAEEVFTSMLLTCEMERKEDLSGVPVVFPIFGRGRALCAVAGKAISADAVLEISGFLAGPCSCMVKDLNPGADMLFRVDWEAVLEGTYAVDEPSSPTAGPARGSSPVRLGAVGRNVLIAAAIVVVLVVSAVAVLSSRGARN